MRTSYKFLISFVFFATALAHAETGSEQEIAFQNSIIRFEATKTNSKLTFSDRLGSRNLEIKKCNTKLVENFWQGLVKSIENLQSPNTGKGRVPSSGAWVKYEGVRFQVLDFEPAIHFFNKVPNNSHVLFAESKRLCRNK